MPHPVRVGLFPYLNVQPIVFGLRAEKAVELVIDVPSGIADRFRRGELDLAMVPSLEAATLNAPVLDSVCIASEGPVETVLLHHRVPLAEIRTVSLDLASRTSAALAKVLVAEASGRLPATSVGAPLSHQTSNSDAILVIGDPAFTFFRTGYQPLDLGLAWHDRYALPFVFAVMVMGPRAMGHELVARLTQATERGRLEASTIAASYNSGVDVARAERYLQKVIRYQLGEREKEGLALFFRRAQAHGLLTQAKELEFHAI